MTDIGNEIAAARKSKGLTQAQLADMLGVGQSWVTQYETGRRNPKPQTLKRFADVLGDGSTRVVEEHLATIMKGE